MRTIKRFGKILMKGWLEDQVPRHSAAIAYYTVFSLPAFAFAILSIAGVIIGPVAVQGELFRRMREMVGGDVTDFLQTTISNVQTHGSSGIFVTISIIILAIGALGVFREVQVSLNEILGYKNEHSAITHFLRSFLLSFLLLVLTAVLLAAAIGSSAILQLISYRIGGYVAMEIETLHLINNVVTWITMIILFFLLYTVLPNRRLPLLPAFLSAIIAGTLLLGGTLGLTLVITHTNVGQVYGVAASLLVLLFWIYYSTNVFLLGAELIDAWENMKKSR